MAYIQKNIYINTTYLCISSICITLNNSLISKNLTYKAELYRLCFSKVTHSVQRGPIPLKKVSHFSDPPIYNKVLSPYIFMNP